MKDITKGFESKYKKEVEDICKMSEKQKKYAMLLNLVQMQADNRGYHEKFSIYRNEKGKPMVDSNGEIKKKDVIGFDLLKDMNKYEWSVPRTKNYFKYRYDQSHGEWIYLFRAKKPFEVGETKHEIEYLKMGYWRDFMGQDIIYDENSN